MWRSYNWESGKQSSYLYLASKTQEVAHLGLEVARGLKEARANATEATGETSELEEAVDSEQTKEETADELRKGIVERAEEAREEIKEEIRGGSGRD